MLSKREKDFRRLIRMVNWYPPYLFSGIKVVDYGKDFTWFKSRLKLTWYNRNLVGTAFGGSLYSMCDPFFMFILIANLGDQYLVWDKHGAIDFVKPGKGTVYAHFEVTPTEIEEVKQKVEELGKFVFEFPCEVRDEKGQLIAKLIKGVYVKKKEVK